MSFIKKNSIALAAVIISAFSCFYTYQQCSLAKNQARLHLEPMIASYIDYPSKEGLSLVVANKGNIPAVSLGVEYKLFVFNKSSRKVEIAMKSSSLLGPASIFVESFKPNDRKTIKLPIVENVDNKIVTYELSFTYFRESDMKEFNTAEYYFYENGQRYTHKQFRKNGCYRDIMIGAKEADLKINEATRNMELLPGVVEALDKGSSR